MISCVQCKLHTLSRFIYIAQTLISCVHQIRNHINICISKRENNLVSIMFLSLEMSFDILWMRLLMTT